MRTKYGHAAQNKNPKQMIYNCLGFLSGTRSRGRTGTTLLSLVFETNASTDSAIRADCPRHAANRVDKDRKNSSLARIFNDLFSDVSSSNGPDAGHRILFGITCAGRSNPAPGGLGPDRSVPTTPRCLPHEPAPPCGSAAAESRRSLTRCRRSAPAHCG